MENSQYTRLQQSLHKHAFSGQIVSTTDIRDWYYQDWPQEQGKAIFPAHFAMGLWQDAHRQVLDPPLNAQARVQPLLKKRYDEMGHLIRGLYEVLHFDQSADAEPVPQTGSAPDWLTRLKSIYQLESTSFLKPESFYPLISRHAPELLRSHDFELALIHSLLHQSFSLCDLLTASDTTDKSLIDQILPLLQPPPQLQRRDLEQGLSYLLEILQTAASQAHVLQVFFNPLHPDFHRHWHSLDQVYEQIQADKRELEIYFNQTLPTHYRDFDPKEVFAKALEWFLGGSKGPQAQHLSQALALRQNRLQNWVSPGTAYWQGFPLPEASRLQDWTEQALDYLTRVPGLDAFAPPEDDSETETYPEVYLASGILAGIFPDYAFAVSPPSYEGLKQLKRLGLGLYVPDAPTDPHALRVWVAQINAQVYQWVQALRTLRPDTAHLISPRRLDMLLYLTRNDQRRQQTVRSFLAARRSENTAQHWLAKAHQELKFKPRPSIPECIQQACHQLYQPGQELTRKQVVAAVHQLYPEIPANSILPSDYCWNHFNETSHSGIYHLFEYLGRGRYRLLEKLDVTMPRARNQAPDMSLKV